MIDHVLAANFDFIGGADSLPGQSGGTEVNLENMVTNVVDILLYVAGALAIIYMIYSGIMYITSAGNPDAVKKGQQGVLNAAIGLVIIVLAFFIARAVTTYTSNQANQSIGETSSDGTGSGFFQ